MNKYIIKVHKSFKVKARAQTGYIYFEAPFDTVKLWWSKEVAFTDAMTLKLKFVFPWTRA